MSDLDSLKMDKSAFRVTGLFDDADDKAYWLTKTPQERLEAVEIMRQIIYGYDPATSRLERVFAITQLASEDGSMKAEG